MANYRNNKNKKFLHDQEKRLKIKFVMTNIRNIITDNRGRYLYIKEADKVFRDIFLEKKFISKLIRCTSTQESKFLLDRIGIDTLHELLNTSSYIEIINTMIELIIRIDHLESKIRKLEKKGKRVPKSTVKEYNYIKDLYKKCVKRIRKDLGLKNSIPYKKKYSSILKYVKGGKKKSAYGLEIFDDDDYDPIFDDYDDDEFDDDSDDLYSEFLKREMQKLAMRYNRFPKKYSNNYDDYDEDYDEFDDDDDYEDYGEDEYEDDELNDRLSAIEDSLRTVNQYLASQNSALNNTVNRRPVRPQLGPDYEYYDDVVGNTPSPVSVETIKGSGFEKKIDFLAKSIGPLVDTIDEMNSRLGSIEADLYETEVDSKNDGNIPLEPETSVVASMK